MKLNPDIIRDILLEVEEITDEDTFFWYEKDKQIHERLKEYTHLEILYHIRQCSTSNLIIGFQPYDGGNLLCIADLTPKGHEFLANIRQDNVWNKTKDIAGKVGSNSLEVLAQIASSVIIDIAKAALGIN